ncbi:SDR family oxidoreductase [Jonesiaceae bacterium BS-20]|uniref:SDR family oxidoreductase n=1 Tax=Jonesiaceae bacterium BS-20 TaxID=3120821 RepID=A0AAU7DYR2_9MICO
MNKLPNLSGKVIAVTGGATGIGKQIANVLGQAGAKVAIGDIDAKAVALTAKELGPSVTGLSLDVTNNESFQVFLAATQAALGPIDVLVNNAGLMWVGPFVDEPESAAARQVAVNLLGVIRGVKLTAPIMLARGSGHIITIASAASVLTTPGEATYAATKHGVYGFLKAARAELHGTPVKLSVIMPAVVNTALAAGTATGAAKLLEPADVALVVARTIARPKFEVTIPGYIGPLQRFIDILPAIIRDPIFRSLVPDQVRQSDSAARADYEAQFDSKVASSLDIPRSEDST